MLFAVESSSDGVTILHLQGDKSSFSLGPSPVSVIPTLTSTCCRYIWSFANPNSNYDLFSPTHDFSHSHSASSVQGTFSSHPQSSRTIHPLFPPSTSYSFDDRSYLYNSVPTFLPPAVPPLPPRTSSVFPPAPDLSSTFIFVLLFHFASQIVEVLAEPKSAENSLLGAAHTFGRYDTMNRL